MTALSTARRISELAADPLRGAGVEHIPGLTVEHIDGPRAVVILRLAENTSQVGRSGAIISSPTAGTVDEYEALGLCFETFNGQPVPAGGAETKGFFFASSPPVGQW